ncbi:MAG TPA: DHA2 family efflux MFS transporter permease subunit [Chlamydiales bacterium]|jgi:DHA2 family multidrug resistance protein|nr:DHA2 family efflux MFS transporter permease subunit [Chlamydiales bacterium]
MENEKKLDIPLLFGIFTALFIVAFSFTMTSMAAPYIAYDLGGSGEISIYTVVFYGIGSAISIPLGKPLAARLKTGRALLVCLLLETLFTWGAATSPTYAIFICFRFLQGIAGGPFYPLLSHLLVSIVPPEKRLLTTSIFVTILVIVPALATCWGGFIAYEYDWRWIFTFNIPWLLLLVGFLWQKLRDFSAAPEKTAFDGIGYFFYAIGLFSLAVATTLAQQLDWYRSPLLETLTLIGAPCFLFFILWTRLSPHPLLDFDILKKPLFCFSLFYLSLIFSIYFGMITLIPVWLKLYANYTPNWIAAILGGMAFSGFLPSYLIQQKMGKLDCRIPLAIALLCLATASFYTTIFDVEINFGRIAFSRIIGGFGLAFFLPPLFQLAFKNVLDEKMIDHIGIFQIVRNLSAGLGVALYDICLQRRQAFFHERLGEKINSFSQLTKNFLAKAKGSWVPGDPNALLGEALQRRATSLALDDVFWLMSWILVALLLSLGFTLVCKKETFRP